MQSRKERKQIEELIDAAARARRAFPRSGFEGLDSTSIQVLLAVMLGDRAGRSTDEVAEDLALDPSTVSHAMTDLTSRKLVRESPASEDRRRRRRRTTLPGRRLARAYLVEVGPIHS